MINLILSVEYQIYDINKQSKIRTSTVFGIPNKDRQLAHYISDGIYEEITGIKGIASTKILYVTENKNFNLVIADADGKNEQVLLESRNQLFHQLGRQIQKKLHMFLLKLVWLKFLFKILQQEKRELVIRK